MLQGMFKRSQVEWAIAQVTGATQGKLTEPTQNLRLRIKRLIDVDRQHLVDPKVSEPEFKRYAFFEGPLPGRGTEVGFSSFDAFTLLIGIGLLEAGVTQSRIIRFIRRARPELESEHKRIVQSNSAKAPKAVRQQANPQPLGQADQVAVQAKKMVSLVLPAVGDELYKRGGRGTGLRLANICRSPKEMAEVAYLATRGGRPAVIFDLATNAIELERQLEKAPVVKRGRRSA